MALQAKSLSGSLASVSAFHSLFQVPILQRPQIPSAERAKLRVRLLQEELDELKAAIDANDLVEAADAFADLQYVLSGSILEFGMGDAFPAIFDEVHRSNMSKACTTVRRPRFLGRRGGGWRSLSPRPGPLGTPQRAEADVTIAHYAAKGVDARVEEVGDKFVVYRQADGKVLKSVNFSPPALARLVAPTDDGDDE